MKYTFDQNKKAAEKRKNEMYEKFDLHEVPEFSVSFRGYNKYETDKYLNALVNAYIQLFEENREMKLELDEYRRNKTVISDTLITAERIMQIARRKMHAEASSKAYPRQKETLAIEQTDPFELDIEALIRDAKNKSEDHNQ